MKRIIKNGKITLARLCLNAAGMSKIKKKTMKKMFSFKIVEKEKHLLKRVNLTGILFL